MATKMTREQFRILNGGTPVPVVAEKPRQDALGTAAKIADTLFGGGKLGEYIGTKVGYALATPEQKKFYDTSTPSAKELVGSAARSALLFAPVGKATALGAGAVRTLAPALGVTAAKTIGGVAAGAGLGYASDVAFNAAENKADVLKPGTGTALGAAIPLIGPLVRGGTRLAQEASGAATGAGFGSVKAAGEATIKGGAPAKAFRDALRGNVDGETIRKEAVDALSQIKQQRSNAYQNQLAQLQTSKSFFDTGPVVSKLYDDLKKFGVDVVTDPKTNLKSLDFSRAPGLARYENEVRQLADTVENWGTKEGDNTILGIDKLKQTIRDFRRGGMESGRLDSLVTGLANEAKNLGKTEKGYNKLLGDYDQATDLIDDITKNLSLGDKTMVDTGIRKLTSVLRTNNEFRRQLVDELNQQTGGTLIPKIAGQQLSEIAPRGLARAIGGIGAVGGLATGVGIVPILKAALFTSPRLAGEVISILGFTGNKAAPLINAISPQGVKVPWQAIFPGEEEPKDYRSSHANSPKTEPANISTAGIQNSDNPSGISSIEKTLPQTGAPRQMTREEFRRLNQMR